APRNFRRFAAWLSAQELQHARLRLVGQRQRRDRDRLAGRQRLAVGRFLVGVGQRQVRRTGLQNVDQVLVEVLTDLHDREVRTQRRGFRTQRGGGIRERGQRLVGRGVVQEVGAAGERRQTEAGRVEGDAGDAQGRAAGFVERQLQGVAVQQVDAVEGRVLRRGVDLRQHVIVLRHQARTGRLGVRTGNGSRRGKRTARGRVIERRARGRRRRTGQCGDRRRSRVVRGRDVELAGRGVDRGLQVVGRQRRIE